jgi:hypothetical protein
VRKKARECEGWGGVQGECDEGGGGGGGPGGWARGPARAGGREGGKDILGRGRDVSAETKFNFFFQFFENSVP